MKKRPAPSGSQSADLAYLDFDFSEDEEGHGSFDAMASVAVDRLPALQAEVARVLHWAAAEFPDSRAPLEQGGEWDFELQAIEEPDRPLTARYDFEEGQLHMLRETAGAARVTLSLTLSGSPTFCAAFRQAFGLD